MDTGTGREIAELPFRRRLIRVLPMLLLSVASVTYWVVRASSRDDGPLVCTPAEPSRTEYLSGDGTWSTTSTPGSLGAFVYPGVGDGRELRSLQLPSGWRLEDATAEQRRALDPYVAGDYVMVESRPATCVDGPSDGGRGPELTVRGGR